MVDRVLDEAGRSSQRCKHVLDKLLVEGFEHPGIEHWFENDAVVLHLIRTALVSRSHVPHLHVQSLAVVQHSGRRVCDERLVTQHEMCTRSD